MKQEWFVQGITYPREHGAWVLLAKSMTLGLILSHSLESVFAAIWMLFIFIATQPALAILKEIQASGMTQRFRTAAVYLSVNLVIQISLLLFLIPRVAIEFWLPILLASILLIPNGFEVIRKKRRSLSSLVLAGLAMAAPLSSLLIAGNFSFKVSILFWALLGLTNILSILYVHCRLGGGKNLQLSRIQLLSAYILCFMAVFFLMLQRLISWQAGLLFFILFIFSLDVLLRVPKPIRPSRVGMREALLGLVSVIWLAIIY